MANLDAFTAYLAEESEQFSSDIDDMQVLPELPVDDALEVADQRHANKVTSLHYGEFHGKVRILDNMVEASAHHCQPSPGILYRIRMLGRNSITWPNPPSSPVEDLYIDRSRCHSPAMRMIARTLLRNINKNKTV